MNLSQTKAALKFVIEAELVHGLKDIPRPVLVGDSGIGKSAIVREIFADMTGDLFPACTGVFIEKHLSQLEIGDIIGMVDIDRSSEKTVWRAPCWWPAPNKSGILFLDEFGDVKNDVQRAAQQLLLERKIYEHVLPERMVTVLAMNPSGDEFGSYEFSRQLRNRLMFWKVEPSLEEWLAYANKKPELIAGIDKVVACGKTLFHDSTEFSVDPGFCNPRSITAAASLAKIMSKDQCELFGFNVFTSVCGPNMAGHLLKIINSDLDEKSLPFNLNDVYKDHENCMARVRTWVTAAKFELVYESASLIASQLKDVKVKDIPVENLTAVRKVIGTMPKDQSESVYRTLSSSNKMLAMQLKMDEGLF